MQFHSSHAIYIFRISCVSFILHNQHDHSYLKHDFKSSLRSENAIRYLIKCIQMSIFYKKNTTMQGNEVTYATFN